MVNVLINGANGKMGKKVFEASLLSETVKAVCGVDLNENLSNPDFPIYNSFNAVKEKIYVIIDFSAPASLNAVLDFALTNNCCAVLCSTGYNNEHLEKINNASKNIAIFRSANMSLGVNILIDLVKKAAKALYGFDVEIIEKHHNQKVDAPSGTAIMLADAIKDVQSEKHFIYGREGQVGKRDKNEVGIHAVRGGTIVGDHDVIFAGNYETVTLSHQATDRSVFASGAIKAAEYISTKTCGLFDMKDVIDDK
ncbi:MAG: 4-hydroxy-tetrahydrodipicolinate reductase [Clostridia bacterium]|nr:4-hydroxy-tetrahydrodipicolinate reductase [Clostridia bacterium]